MTPDLRRLRDHLSALAEAVDELGLELVEDPHWSEPSDTSYLRPDERADPDIAANVEAMAATNAMIAWFGRDREGFVGLWRGPEQRPLDDAPVVRLDTEGRYDIVAASVADYVLISTDPDAFDDHRGALLAAGFSPSASPEEIWARVPASEEANAFRHELYNEGRLRRGLPRFQ